MKFTIIFLIIYSISVVTAYFHTNSADPKKIEETIKNIQNETLKL